MNEIKRSGVLFVVSGPSGSGKSTLCRDLMKKPDFPFGLAVSHTTRAIRPREVDGIDYHFLSKEDFERNLARGLYLEYALVHGNYYGTPQTAVDAFLSQSKHGILEIDVQGGLQVKAKKPDTVLIFVCPPRFSILEARLKSRATDSEDVIARRIHNAIDEIKKIPSYDYLIINDNYDLALKELESILYAEQNRISRLNPENLYDTMQLP